MVRALLPSIRNIISLTSTSLFLLHMDQTDKSCFVHGLVNPPEFRRVTGRERARRKNLPQTSSLASFALRDCMSSCIARFSSTSAILSLRQIVEEGGGEETTQRAPAKPEALPLCHSLVSQRVL